MLRRLITAALLLSTLGADCASTEPFKAEACPPPTIEQCQKPQTACDSYFKTQARTDPDAACSLLLSQAAVHAKSLFATKTVLIPKTWSGIRVFPSDGGTAEVAAVPEDSDLKSTGMTGFRFGQRQNEALLLRGSDPVLALGARLRLSDEVGQYNSNLDAVASCEEYEFEKFFDAAAWEAQVILSNALDKPRKAFELAYGPAAERTSIGTRHLTDPVIRSRSGTPSGATVPFEPQRPKNDYFRVPLPATGAGKIVFRPGAADAVGTDALGRFAVTMKSLTRAQLEISGVAFDDPALKQNIKDGQATYLESFGWHLAMSNRNSKVLDEQLLLEHDRRDAFLDLIADRDDVVRQIAEYATGSSSEVPVVGSNRFATRWWLDDLWNPNPTEAVAEINAVTASLATQVPSFNLGKDQTFVTYSNQVSPSRETLSPTALTSGFKSNVQVPCNGTGNPFFCLVYRLQAIDQAIEDQLIAARERGCLDLNVPMRDPVPCDWSPRDFTQRLRGFADAKREAAFEKCDESIDSFIDLKNRALVQDRADGGVGVDFPAQDYTVDTDGIDLFYQRQDQYLQVIGDVVGPLLERKPVDGRNKLRLSRYVGEQHQLGDDWFGAAMNYSIGFAMDGLPADPVPAGTTLKDCEIKTRADAKFGLVAKVLEADINLIDAYVHAQDERFDAKVQVLDQVWEGHQLLTDGLVPVFTDSQMAYTTFLEGSATFAIGYILISVGAAVSGGVGYGVSVKVGRETVMSGGCKVSRLGVYPTVTPLTFVEGSAYAALEAIVARAGIKGYLTIASISVPISGELSIGPTMADPTILDARFKIGAKLRMQFFGGRIVVFAEVGICPLCASFEGTLISWDGIRHDLPLFEYGLELRLADLKRVAGQQGVLLTGGTP